MLILESLPENQEAVVTPLETETVVAAILEISSGDTGAGKLDFEILPLSYLEPTLSPVHPQ